MHGLNIFGQVLEIIPGTGADGLPNDRWRIVRGIVPNSCPKHRNDPRAFCRKVLGVHPLVHQLAILLSVRDNKSTAVASCHGAGKSQTAAIAVLWFFSTRKPALVFTTAPTDDQVKGILWAYISSLHANAKRRLPGVIQTKAIKTGDELWKAKGRAARDGNAAQGMHSANLLIVYDEAAGVRDEIPTSLEGAMGDENSRQLAIGNPTSDSGFFRDAWGKAKEFWTRFNISALDLINVRRKRRIIPGLTGHEWVEEKRRQFGENSPYWICRILGRFASFADAKVCDRDRLKQAKARWFKVPVGGRRILGVDIAGSGEDFTAMVLLEGRRLSVVEKFQQPDPMAQARYIVDTAQELGVDAIHMDATSLGWALFGKVRELCEERKVGFDVVDVVLGRASRYPLVYTRLLDEVWFAAREALDPANAEAVAIDPDDEDLSKQLNVRGWRLDDRARIKVETKKELRKRGAGSPDVGDAAVLCFYNPQLPEVSWFSSAA